MTQKLPPYLKDFAIRVAQHEMGHYVVARALGFRTGDVSVVLTGPMGDRHGTAAVTLPTATGSVDQIADYLRRRVIVLFAGAVAEALPPYGSPSKEVDVQAAVDIIQNPGNGAEQDHAKAKELIHVLRNVTGQVVDCEDDVATQAELTLLDRELFGRAIEIVEANVDTILGLAGNLSSRVTAMKIKAVMTAAELEGLPSVKNIVRVNLASSGASV